MCTLGICSLKHVSADSRGLSCLRPQYHLWIHSSNPNVHHLSYPIYFKFALVCFLLPPSPILLWMLLSHPLTGATPPIGHLSQCVHPLSLTTTSQARRASWRTPSRALHALHLLIRGIARTGTHCPFPSMPLYTAPPLSSPFLH